MKTISVKSISIFLLLLSFEVKSEGAQPEDGQRYAEKIQDAVKEIEKTKDPLVKSLKYVDFALGKLSERSVNLETIYLNVPGPNSIHAGGDPKAILDPQERRKYEAAIQKNNKNIRQQNEAIRLRNEAVSMLLQAKRIASEELKEDDRKIILNMISKIELMLSKYSLMRSKCMEGK